MILNKQLCLKLINVLYANILLFFLNIVHKLNICTISGKAQVQTKINYFQGRHLWGDWSHTSDDPSPPRWFQSLILIEKSWIVNVVKINESTVVCHQFCSFESLVHSAGGSINTNFLRFFEVFCIYLRHQIYISPEKRSCHNIKED